MGVCRECGERMGWSGVYGWVHFEPTGEPYVPVNHVGKPGVQVPMIEIREIRNAVRAVAV